MPQTEHHHGSTKCPGCDGRGCYMGDSDDHLYGGIRVPSSDNWLRH